MFLSEEDFKKLIHKFVEAQRLSVEVAEKLLQKILKKFKT